MRAAKDSWVSSGRVLPNSKGWLLVLRTGIPREWAETLGAEDCLGRRVSSKKLAASIAELFPASIGIGAVLLVPNSSIWGARPTVIVFCRLSDDSTSSKYPFVRYG